MIGTNDKKAFKSGMWYIIINVFIKFIGFISLPIFLRILSKNDVGKFENFNSWLTILLPIVTLCFSSSITVAKFEFKEKLDEYIKAVLILGSAVTLIVYVVCSLFGNTVANLLKIDEKYLNILFLYCMFAPALEILQTKSRLEYKYILSSVLSIISSGLFLLIALVSTSYSNNKLSGRIYN